MSMKHIRTFPYFISGGHLVYVSWFQCHFVNYGNGLGLNNFGNYGNGLGFSHFSYDGNGLGFSHFRNYGNGLGLSNFGNYGNGLGLRESCISNYNYCEFKINMFLLLFCSDDTIYASYLTKISSYQ